MKLPTRSPWLRVAALFAVTILPLLLLTALSVWRGERAAEDRAAEQRRAAAQAAALSVAAAVNEDLGTVHVLTTYTGLIFGYFEQLSALLSSASGGGGDDAAPASAGRAPQGLIARLLQNSSAPEIDGSIALALAADPDWEDVGLYEVGGTPVGRRSNRPEPVADLASQPYFQRALTTDQAVISPAVLNVQTGKPTVLLLVPASLITGDRGIVVVALSIARLAEKLRALYGASGNEIVLVDAAGTAFVQADAEAAARLPDWRDRPEVKAVLANQSGSRRIRDARGRDLLVAYAPAQTPDVGWGVLIYQPTGSVLGPARGQLIGSLGLLAVTIAVTGLLAWYFAVILARASARQSAALASARRAGQARDEFLASASHELRTPLSHIKGFASTLRQTDVDWDAEARDEFLAEIEGETDRLATMIGDLLDMSRLESGGMDSPVREPATPAALVEGGIARVRMQLGGRAIEVEAPPGLPPLLVDTALIERVIANLLENAVKYSPAQGVIHVSAALAGDAIELRVEDDGPGIPAEYLDLVFEKFFRVKGDGRSAIPGTGLGLAICRGIVEAHGGQIWAENRPSGGACFSVRLPLSNTEPANS